MRSGIERTDREIAYLRFPGGAPVKLELYTLAEPPPAEASYERRLGITEIALRIADVEAQVERLRKAGVEILAKPNFSEAPGVAAASPVKKRIRGAIKAPDGVSGGLYHWD